MPYEVEVNVLIEMSTGTLAIILTHGTDDQRRETELLLERVGGELLPYPVSSRRPATLAGSAVFCDGTLTVTAGTMFIVGSSGLTIGEVALAKNAVLFVNDKNTFDPNDETEMTWMAVSLTLNILERDEV